MPSFTPFVLQLYHQVRQKSCPSCQVTLRISSSKQYFGGFSLYSLVMLVGYVGIQEVNSYQVACCLSQTRSGSLGYHEESDFLQLPGERVSVIQQTQLLREQGRRCRKLLHSKLDDSLQLWVSVKNCIQWELITCNNLKNSLTRMLQESSFI